MTTTSGAPFSSLTSLVPAWRAFKEALPIRLAPIRSQAEYKRVVAFMNSLLDVVGDDEAHELAGLLDLVGQLVQEFDDIHHAIPQAPGHEVLRFLMELHGLKQGQLANEIGTQSVVSEVLSGKREINARQARALAARFGVSVAAFI